MSNLSLSLSFCLAVTEWGDDVRPISEEEAMVIVNHQSTGDVCTLMMCLQDKGTVVRKMMWLMDHVFKYTNFGLVSLIHGDFFIRQNTTQRSKHLPQPPKHLLSTRRLSRHGKAHRDKQLVYLKDHLDKYYHSRDRKWIVLFPEGGFLRNKRKGLQWVIDMTIAYPKARPMDIQTWIFGYRPATVTHVHY
ncbi:hypothetical protein INR49_026331, partial [Caranx melampygus]